VNGNCSACIANCEFCNANNTCFVCAQDYQLALNSSTQCVPYVTSGEAAGIALGVIGCAAGIVAVVLVLVK